jgi:hypothetical protein
VISLCSSTGYESLFCFVRKWILGCLVLTTPCSLFTMVQVLRSLFSLPWSQFCCQVTIFPWGSSSIPCAGPSLSLGVYLLSFTFPAHPQSVRRLSPLRLPRARAQLVSGSATWLRRLRPGLFSLREQSAAPNTCSFWSAPGSSVLASWLCMHLGSPVSFPDDCCMQSRSNFDFSDWRLSSSGFVFLVLFLSCWIKGSSFSGSCRTLVVCSRSRLQGIWWNMWKTVSRFSLSDFDR